MIDIVSKAIKKIDLKVDEAYQLANLIVDKELKDNIIETVLISLAEKGESESEILGFVKAFKERMIKVKYDDNSVIDVCGMGGDKSNTFNISTATALVLAAYGIKVAKHGNRAVSSASGSSDVLNELGIPFFNEQDKIAKMLDETNFVFLFAPNFHPAFKNVAEIRKKIGRKTIFNMLGPLLNPIEPKMQLIGTPNYNNQSKIFNTVKELDYDIVSVLCENDKYDEVVLEDEVKVLVKNHSIHDLTFKPDYFNTESIDINKIKCNSPKESAEIILSVIKDKIKSPAYNVLVANSALALFLLEAKKSLEEYLVIIDELISSGKVYDQLQKIQNFN